MARVVGAKGLAGAFRIEALTDVPGRLAEGARLYVEDEAEPRRVVAYEAGGRVPVLALEGIDDRTAAEALVGRYLEVEAVALPDGTWYWHQIVGLGVIDHAGRPLGRVAEVFRAGENEVYRVVGADGELLIPALRDVVLDVDLERGSMTVRYEPEEVR
ncbi:MAG TPA: ribosome maturation factor RimM [Candidatus Limnocylindria bacterium]|nr:ribosome maturation factor RimM [Candidatus Limnocylindria bacterium]